MRSSALIRVAALIILALMLAPLAMAAGLVPGPEFLGFGPGLAAHNVGAGIAMASVGLWIRPVLMEQAEDPGQGGEGGASSGLAKVMDKKMTLGARLEAAGAMILKGDAAVADLNARIAELEGQVVAKEALATTLQGQLDQANARIVALEADAKEAEAALGKIEAEATKLKGEAKTVDQKTKEQMRALGFPAANLPAAQSGDDLAKGGDVPSNREELKAAIEKCKTEQERQDLLASYEKAQAAA